MIGPFVGTDSGPGAVVLRKKEDLIEPRNESVVALANPKVVVLFRDTLTNDFKSSRGESDNKLSILLEESAGLTSGFCEIR